jgi:hypothetical protein
MAVKKGKKRRKTVRERPARVFPLSPLFSGLPP